MSELILVANAADGTISTLRLHRDPAPRLEVLATSGDVDGCGTFAVDADRDLVFAAYKGEPAGIATLRADPALGSAYLGGDALVFHCLRTCSWARVGSSRCSKSRRWRPRTSPRRREHHAASGTAMAR